MAGLAAAKDLFLRLLGCAQSQQQLLTLLKLLSHAWDNGAVFTAAEQVLISNNRQMAPTTAVLPSLRNSSVCYTLLAPVFTRPTEGVVLVK